MSAIDPTAVEPAEQLANYVTDAIQLRRKLRGWQRDSEFIADDGRIIYSVDADVIKLFLDPLENAVARTLSTGALRAGYTQVFRNDEAHTSVALAEAVCRAIFFPTSERAVGVVILPPLREEVNNIFHALLADAREVEKLERPRLGSDEALLSQLASSEISPAEKYDLLRQELPEVAKHFLEGRGPQFEIRRLNELSRTSKLEDLDVFLARQGASIHESAKLRLGGELRQALEYAQAQQSVFDHLSIVKRPRNARRDIQAVTRLLYMNRRVAEDRMRVVHVTGDRTLLSATATLDIELPGGNSGTFADLYLRHPASFLAAPDVAFPKLPNEAGSPITDEGIIAWLDVFLTEFNPEADLSHDDTIRRARGVLERDPEALAQFETRWSEFVTPMVLKQVEAADQRMRTVNSPGFFAGLGERIDAEFADTWKRWFETAMATGYNFTEVSRSRKWGPPRDVPLVWFDCESAADRALADIQAALDSAGGGETAPERDYQTSIFELRELDDTGYFYTVGFAALFASANRWRTALILAEQAIGISDKVSEASGGSDRISGREAYYVASVARRNIAASVEDFDASEAWLKKAVSALEIDRRNWAAEGDDPADLSSLRFEAELLALDLSRYLFARFRGDRRPKSLERHIFLSRLEHLLGRLPEESDLRIRSALKRRLLVNLFSRFLHDDDWRAAALASPEQGARLRTRLDELRASLGESPLIRTDPPAPRSYLHQAVLTAALGVLQPPATRGARKSLRDLADQLFTAAEMRNNRVTSYDQQRFEELRRLSDLR